MHMHMHMYMHMHMHIYMHMHMHMCACACGMCMCMWRVACGVWHVHVCVCVCVWCRCVCVQCTVHATCLHESLEDWHVQHSAAALKRGDGGDGGGTPPAPLSRDGVVCGVVQPLGAERALEYQGGGGGERGSAHRGRQVRQGLALAAWRGRVSQGGYGLGAPCARPEHGAAAARAAAARRRLHDRGS